MKRVLITLMVIATFFSISITASYAESSSFSKEKKYIIDTENELVSFAVDVVEKYYKNKDLGENNDISKLVSGEALKLINTKIEMGQFQNKTLDCSYNDYKIEVLPFDIENWYKDNEKIVMILQVKRSWFYDDNDEKTTSSELQEMTVSKNKNDKYVVDSCYDKYESVTLGPIDEIHKKTLLSKASVDTKLKEYLSNFKSQCLDKRQQMLEEQSTRPPIDKKLELELNKEVKLRSHKYFTRSDIRIWARDNYDKDQPESSTSSVPYYDFSEIPKAFDCTNFVSHALLAGGAEMHDDGGSGIVGTDQWYYRNNSNRSSSWAGVTQLHEFLTRSNPGDNNIGPYVEEKDLNYQNAFTGDIVQGYNGDVWMHSTVVTKFKNRKVYVTGRSADGMYNDNQLATTIYGQQRLLHLKGCYH